MNYGAPGRDTGSPDVVMACCGDTPTLETRRRLAGRRN